MVTDLKSNQQISYIVNFSIFVLVLIMMAIFDVMGAKALAFYSIFVAVVYLLNFLFIYKMKLRLYIWSTYTMLTVYMVICTIMLGLNYGFNLYSLSTIPLIYYVKYISIKLKSPDPKPLFWTIVISISCIASSLHTAYFGPIYNIGGHIPIVFLGINTFSVCTFLFVFSKKMIMLVVDSETKLEIQANYDALTNLPNRYNMRSVLLNAVAENNRNCWLAMIDIDKFKTINDTYGHNIGDEVLKQLAVIMTQVCTDCKVARWGGEEFLIYGESKKVSPEIIETLRKTVEDNVLEINNNQVKFTVTAGVSVREDKQPMDKWIISADNKLYSGKEDGRNVVIY